MTTNAERLRQHILVYLPESESCQEAAQSVRDTGGVVVWRLDGQSPEIEVGAGDWARIGVETALPGQGGYAGVVLAAEHALDAARLARRIKSMRGGDSLVYVEVTDVKTAKRCEQLGVDGIIACGFEVGGFAGEESGLVLLRRLYCETGLAVIVRGGIGPDSAAAVMATGASGYVLEEQLWLCPELPVADSIARRLENFNPTDTRCLGMTLGFRYRVFALIASRKPKELAKREVQVFEQGGTPGDFLAEIHRGEPADRFDFDLRGDLWPLGQGAAMAANLRDRFETVRGVLVGMRGHVEDVLAEIVDDFPLEEGKGIAAVNGTKFPIHQGPMAQVSDTPAFARAVADGGALPWLALGNMPIEIAEDIVSETGRELGDHPYGAGIIGLDANRYRDGHMEMVKEKRKRGAILGLVAAGTAEQAMQFESANVSSYLHTPTPGVLRAALRSGHRKFLVEGSEAGGHVGTLGGLALWQYAVVELEAAIADGVSPADLVVVPAGGISDAASAAAVSALFFKLYKQGVRFGIQMGTAYLMTREAVETGALSATFQEVACASDGTVIMGETVNTPTRVLYNSASDRVLDSEKERLLDGVNLKERKHLYEKDNLGGLRAAAKGQKIAEIDPKKGAIFAALSRQEQLDQGLFHCGQGIAMCQQGYTIDALHKEVTEHGRRWASDQSWRASFRPPSRTTGPREQSMVKTNRNTSATEIIDGDQEVAIIGIGAKMPGALSKDAFWNNIVGGKSSISTVPKERWDPALYYDADPSAPDKTYSKIGGWVTGFEFDRRSFRLPPKVVESIDPTQLLCLEAVKEALDDSGYLDADFDRDRCAVILGNALGGDLRDSTNLRIMYPQMDRVLRGVLMELGAGKLSEYDKQELLTQVEERYKRDIVGINEDSMPGELANIIAGRVAQSFDLRGPNFITDAACASSLAAIEAAVRGIRAGQFDMAVTGGADRSMGPPSYVKFSKIGALSPDGSRPFDADANGFVMGEGAGIIILKRLSDAIRDGDSVYALVRGVGGSSDGRGKAITAPNPEGQKLAMQRAYKDAGFGPNSVSLIEAHGTSTSVGDPAEVESIQAVLAQDNSTPASDRVALGSVKSMIGHLKSAAGAAGIIKAALALEHRVLPPTLNVKDPNPKLQLAGSTLSIQNESQDWKVRDGSMRRAGVSAFGFGGTNFHVVLEEFEPGGSNSGKSRSFPGFSASASGTSGAMVCTDIPGGEGIVAFGCVDKNELRTEFEQFSKQWDDRGEAGIASWKMSFADGVDGVPSGRVRLAISYGDVDELTGKIAKTWRALEGRMSWRVLANQGVIFGDDKIDGKMAMLFPGQGTQYLGMLSDLRERFSVVAETFDEADRIMEPVLGRKLSEIVDPDLEKVNEIEAFKALTQTEITQPAVLTANIAIYRLLESLGIEPSMVAGHSLGEYGACVAAGVMTFEEALKTVAARGTEMSQATPMNGDNGLMAGISASVDIVQPVLDDIDGYVVCANINCPGQTIIAGLTDAVQQAVERFESMDYQVPLLPVSHAFHTEVVAAASVPLRSHLEGMDVRVPDIPILTNVTGGFYPNGADEIRDLLATQVASPVLFIDLIETMYDQGVRTFIEVGPKRAQTSFVGSILEDREHLALYTNHPKKGGVATLYEALATLWVHGVWGALVDENHQNKYEVKMMKTPENKGSNKVSGTFAKTSSKSHIDRDEITKVMLNVLCEKTGYDPSEIEFDFELEADLGVDTVKQAEIMAEVREEFSLVRDEEFRLADYPTLARMTDYVVENLGGESGSGENKPADKVSDTLLEGQGSGSEIDRAEITKVMLNVLCEKTGYDPSEIEFDFELEADLGVDTVKQAEIMAEVREEFSLVRDEEFRLADYPTLARMTDYVVENLGGESGNGQDKTADKVSGTLLEPGNAGAYERSEPATRHGSELNGSAPAMMNGAARTSPVEFADKGHRVSRSGDDPAGSITRHDIEADVVISGCAVGLPGTKKFFDDDTVERLLVGTNFIKELSEKVKRSMVEKRITRVQKHEDGGGELVEVTDTEEVIKLAGQRGEFDLSEWGVSERFIEALDRTSQLAFAAGFEALRDAGLPLIPRYRETTTGKKVTIGWTLPQDVGDETGIIFASAFAGQDALIEELTASQEEDYQFNHRFLLRVLGIANARFAEFVGARGPNTKINNACASTTTAIAMAQDWIQAGRCKRVIVLSADDASGDTLMEWVGSGFLATGAATTEREVSEAALPFDRRRHGMIVGMGALSLIVEAGGLPESRGIEPIADVLATRFVNSAFHPTRLDVDHIAGHVSELVGDAETSFEIDRKEIADRTVFISHETYTPARGGSAAAEISALRQAFGEDASKVVIANTKGFTGHAMGAGIEDVLAMKVLQHESVPPIANFSEPDPDLGDLRLSQGGDYDVDYALRLAAGFGSQLALALFRFRARGEDRVFDAVAYGDWLSQVSGFERPELSVENRVLRLRRGQPEDQPPGDSVLPERSRPRHNPFDFEPVGIRAHSSATADLDGLRDRLQGKKVALVGGASEVNSWMRQTLERGGAEVVAVDSTTCSLLDESAVADRLQGVDGMVNLLGFGTDAATDDDVYLAVRQTFHIARAFAEVCGGEPGGNHFFVAVTGQGGRLGLARPGMPRPESGAVGGFTKALFHEWSDADVRVVDIAGDGLSPTLGLHVFDALFDGLDSPEVGIFSGIRYQPIFQKLTDVVEASDRGSFAPTRESVIVVTGGAKGITAEVCVDLANRFGCKLALVGRSELTHVDPLSVDMDNEKERVRAELEASGQRVTPVKVRDALWSLNSQRAVATNMARMTKAGGEVEYFSCDVSDALQVSQLFGQVRKRFGTVTGVIHGAGAEESKLLRDKNVKSFDKVFCGKALGGLHLWNEVRTSDPEFFVAFTSVAGRFGNEGQTDYSAANETLAKLVARINATTEVRALAIDWTAWSGVGMAVAGSMETILKAQGVEFLPADVGATMVGDALEDGLVGESLVAGELGDFGGDFVVCTPLVPDIDTTRIDELALVESVIERGENHIVLERIFDGEHDLFIDHHVYEGTAILPGVMGFELMADAAQVLTGQTVAEVTDASFERAIKLHHGQPVRLTTLARVTDRADGRTTVETVVKSHRTSRTGRVLEKEHFRAVVRCDSPASNRSREVADSFVIDSQDFRRGPGRAEIYRRFFHTGTFRVLEKVPVISDDFIVGYGRVPGAKLVDSERSGGFITDPLVREMALQTVGLWGMVENGLSYLPLGIGRSVQFRRAQAGEEICIRGRRRHDASEHAIAFDVEILDAHGALLHRLDKVELIGHQKLREEEKFGQLEPLRKCEEWLSESEAMEILAARDIDMKSMLSDEETEAYERLRSPGRRGEWMASRVAARRVVSRYSRDFFGEALALDGISVTKSESGKPSIMMAGEDTSIFNANSKTALPELTLTHCGGIAIAAITLPGRPERIGVDLERIEERSKSFIESYFTADEQNLTLPVEHGGHQRSAALDTALWSIKESVAKALGRGLELSTHEIEVRRFHSRDAESAHAVIDLRGRALKALQELGGGDIDVEVKVAGGFVTATAWLDLSAETPARWLRATTTTGATTNGATASKGTNGVNGINGTNGSNRKYRDVRAVVAALLGHGGPSSEEESEKPRSWTF